MRPASLLAVLIGGTLFGFGLALSTMISPEVVLSFLRLRDFGLMLVLGGAVVVTLVAYRYAAPQHAFANESALLATFSTAC